MTAPWLQRHLEAIGAWNGDGVGRTLRGGTCTRCRARVLRGLDADRIAGAATVDPHPVDAHGELAAVLAGRTTYGAWPSAAGAELERRDAWAMRKPPSSAFPVMVEHECGKPIPAAAYSRTHESPAIPDDGEAPF